MNLLALVYGLVHVEDLEQIGQGWMSGADGTKTLTNTLEGRQT